MQVPILGTCIRPLQLPSGEAGTASVSCLNLSLGLRFDLHIVCYTDIRTPRVAASLGVCTLQVSPEAATRGLLL